MKKSTVFFVLLLQIFFAANAQDTNTLLYKISGAHIFTSYVFGTMHLVPTADFELPKKVTEALLATQQLVLELDITDPMMLENGMRYMPMKNDTNMYQLLDTAKVLRIDSMLQHETGMTMAMLQTFKPAIVSTFLMPKFIGKNTVSYESELANLAQNAEIKIVALETMAQQMQIFDDIPYSLQAEELYGFVEDDGEMARYYNQLLKLYLSEDLTALSRLTESYFTSPQEKEVMLDARNDAWVPQLEKMMRTKPSFIAVGAGHLGGPRGILAQLAALGYTVTPLF